ncbi:MAG: hypothetical protein AAF918_00190 [Pseudomonadota bacterium]
MRNFLLGFTAATLIFFTGQWIGTSARSLDWNEQSRVASPDARHALVHYQSTSEAGHAPYGDHLVLESSAGFGGRSSSAIVFAGFCETLDIGWTDAVVRIACPTNEPIATSVDRLLGYAVTLED